MMELFGLGLKRLPAHKYADDRNEIPAVRHPRLTTILTSTPQTYERAISQEDSESGMLNRFLAFREEEDVPPLRQGRVDRDLTLYPHKTSSGQQGYSHRAHTRALWTLACGKKTPTLSLKWMPMPTPSSKNFVVEKWKTGVAKGP
jgi:hypothetical protein